MRIPSLISFFAVLLTAGAVTQVSQRSSGCGKPIPDVLKLGESRNFTLDTTSKPSPRNYRLHAPESYKSDVPVPLILSFHGRGKDMEEQEGLSQFSNASYGFEGISVYPEGVPSKKGSHPKQWQGDPDAPTDINDVAFTLELIDHILDRYCIDPTRIYASGKSNGGGFTGILACDPTASSRIAAFAPVSGAFYLNQTTQQSLPCTLPPNRRAVPIMELHGAKDKQIVYGGGPNLNRNNETTENIPAWVHAWVERDGLDVEKNITGTLCKGVREVQTWSWNDTVLHYLYANMGHAWPSQFGNDDSSKTTCEEADGTRVLLDWFEKWSL